MRLLVMLSRVSLLVSAGTIPKPHSKRADACGSVRDQLRSAPQNKQPSPPPNSSSPTNATLPKPQALIPGQAAHDCLRSLPFDFLGARAFLSGLQKYVEFQSTIEALRDPPDSYASEPVDIFGGLEQIGGNNYESLYDFNVDLKALFTSAHDGHFGITPCTSDIFRFQRDHDGIVSVSEDGLAPPELFAFSDIEASQKGKASISPIAEINGRDALEYLQDLARMSSSQDPDSRWNELFRSPSWLAAQTIHPAGSFIENDGAWPGAGKTTVRFTNGSSVDIETLAGPFGKDAFNGSSADEVLATYCRPPPPGPPSPPPPPDGPFDSGIPGYPEPIARDPHNEVSGYFLDNETAVMVISSFGGSEKPEDYSLTYANVAKDIIAKAKASGRNKLILDVSGNGGGSPIRFLNIFKVLFPGQFPFDALRFRRSPATDILTKVFGALNRTDAASLQTGLAFPAMVAPDQVHGFQTASDILGDERPQLGVEVSAVYTLNFTLASTEQDPLEGFVPPSTTFDTAPFKPEDILVVGNGFCHSSCAGFVNIMANVGGVKTLAFGGRPQNGPMQIMGGVRGGQQILSDEKLLAGKPPPLSPEELDLADKRMPPPLPGLPFKFEFQAASCRLFYTRENIMDPKTSWTAAKEAIWGGGKCVEGSAGVAGGGREFKPQR
ncbi:peptidase S41 family protein ustP [Hirsutella rhossiliensis]|uniref:Peptidase S41 family protein ustP n=1 Tax=Hirsutella rhossiliensis TaxID=111463 RepID=A0A9P8MQ04_9HYPO|nr:peptidase S41 family protein ustP [Hirsutella rhossiliensis]KAH0958076.1 peptidase S41 family protein ustP [Hirsutella rhossiliensis]